MSPEVSRSSRRRVPPPSAHAASVPDRVVQRVRVARARHVASPRERARRARARAARARRRAARARRQLDVKTSRIRSPSRGVRDDGGRRAARQRDGGHRIRQRARGADARGARAKAEVEPGRRRALGQGEREGQVRGERGIRGAPRRGPETERYDRQRRGAIAARDGKDGARGGVRGGGGRGGGARRGGDDDWRRGVGG